VALEQEVKLAYPDAEAARQAVLTAGGRLVLLRRLIEDRFFDTTDTHLRRAGTTLRVRRDGAHTRLTWKGPIQSGPVKSREELETTVGDAATLVALLAALGYQPFFCSEKYREEYALDEAMVTIDETPAGIFVEIEAIPETIERIAARLGRTPADYQLESYPELWRRWCEMHGLGMRDMVFSASRSG
jgi:adenylate cyclase class 2